MLCWHSQSLERWGTDSVLDGAYKKEGAYGSKPKYLAACIGVRGRGAWGFVDAAATPDLVQERTWEIASFKPNSSAWVAKAKKKTSAQTPVITGVPADGLLSLELPSGKYMQGRIVNGSPSFKGRQGNGDGRWRAGAEEYAGTHICTYWVLDGRRRPGCLARCSEGDMEGHHGLLSRAPI